MGAHPRLSCWIGPVTVLLLSVTGCRGGPGEIGQPRADVTDSLLAATDAADTAWLLYGGDYGNSRFSHLRQIDVASVPQLRLAWSHTLGKAPLSETLFGVTDSPRVWYRPRTWGVHPRHRGNDRQISTPLVAEGRIYYTGAYNVVVAVDAASGKEVWRYQHRMRRVPLLCCGPHNRGAALFKDLLFVATLDAHLIALRRSTGALVWDIHLAEPGDGYSVTMAPLAAAGEIIVGVSGADYGIRGFVDAYDPETGKRIWRFWTVPSPMEGGWWGAWSATTPDGDSLPRDLAKERGDSARFQDSWRHGGGSVWMTPAYDPALGWLFLGVGNPAPALDGSVRPGDNLYTASIVALDARTGALRWYYQIVPHDLWDSDVGNPVVLFSVPRGDSLIPSLGLAAKTGWLYVLDRRTGRRLLRSQPFVPQKGLFARPTLSGGVTYPAIFGGARGALPAYSPRTGLMYVMGQHQPTLIRRGSGPYVPGSTFFGGVGTPVDTGATGPAWGTVTAFDVSTGAIRWQHRTATPIVNGGLLATAGGLVFFGEEDSLHAADAANGRRLWSYEAPAQVDGAPITFELHGRQYVAVVSRMGLLVFTLGGKTGAS